MDWKIALIFVLAFGLLFNLLGLMWVIREVIKNRKDGVL